MMGRHGPGDGRAVSLWLEGEIRIAGALERLDEIDLEHDGIVGLAFDHGHLACADLVVAGPGHCRPLPRFRSFEADLRVGIELRPRRPRVPFVAALALR